LVHGISNKKEKKKKTGLMIDKNYISKAYLQGGKTIDKIIRKKKKK